MEKEEEDIIEVEWEEKARREKDERVIQSVSTSSSFRGKAEEEEKKKKEEEEEEERNRVTVAGPRPPTFEDISRLGEEAFDERQKRALSEEYMRTDAANAPASDTDGEKKRRRAKRVLLDLMGAGENFDNLLAEYKRAGVVDETLVVVTSARLRTARAAGDSDIEELLTLVLMRLMRELAVQNSSPGMRLVDELLQDRFMNDDEATKYFIEKRLRIGEHLRGVDVIGVALSLSNAAAAAAAAEDGTEMVALEDFFASIDDLLNTAKGESDEYRNMHAGTLSRLVQIKTWTLDSLRTVGSTVVDDTNADDS